MSERDRATDPVGRLIDEVAEIIFEFKPTGRRRLTSSLEVARDLAEEIVDFVWEFDPEAAVVDG